MSAFEGRDVKRRQRLTGVDSGDEQQDQWPPTNEEEPGITPVNRGNTADPLDNIVTMTLNDDVYDHDEERQSQADRKLDDFATTAILSAEVHLPSGGN